MIEDEVSRECQGQSSRESDQSWTLIRYTSIYHIRSPLYITLRTTCRLKHFQTVCGVHEIQRVELHVDMAHAGGEGQAVEMMKNMARKLEDESLGRCVEVSVNPFDRG